MIGGSRPEIHPVGRMRGKSVILCCLLLSAFSPYVWGRVRADALVLYLIACLALLQLVRERGRIGMTPRLLAVVFMLTALLLWPLVISLSGFPLDAEDSIALIARLDNYLRPVLLVGILIVFFGRLDPKEHAQLQSLTARLVVVMALVNVLFIVMHETVGIRPFLELFHPPMTSTRPALWDRAASMGRLTGLFSSPFEMGVFSGVSLLSLIWLYRVGVWTRVFPLLTIGILASGALSVSRAFLFVGLPLALTFWLLTTRSWTRSGWSRVRPVTSAAAVVVVAVSSALIYWMDWPGRDRLLRQVSVWTGEGTLDISLATGGRYGSGGGLGEAMTQVIARGEFVGQGLHVRGVVDSAFYEHLIVGGLFNIIIYSALIGALLIMASRRRGIGPDRFMGMILVVAVFAWSTGAPTLTMNRVLPVLWMVLGLWVFLNRPSPGPGLRWQDYSRAATQNL